MNAARIGSNLAPNDTFGNLSGLSSMNYLIDLFRRSRLVRLWAPVFLWMGAIFYFSSRPNPLGFLPSSRHTGGIDKLAHIGEYAGLAALLYRALSNKMGQRAQTNHKGQRTSSSALSDPYVSNNPDITALGGRFSLCFAIALAYALFDELHQELAPGRGFELADIGYDSVGIIAALGLIWVRERRGE
jgi:hypothetical protein